ncbi:acetylornithine deacetylase [Palleronia aestuarii]|uniref:Acetylornithine deacetylase n=1 Tax=Palleronia aestuarii TaxID=568105 RepID=A0A2W7NA23_9RHOB|nr:ArgE/DapE family deacylase [Palleronia aestuarii]PZX17091.1 acetylornithine deacetylase [Palleronia aestuarii]
MPTPSVDPALHETLRQSVADGFAAQLDLTAEFVGCPSQRGAEHAMQDIVFAALRDRGLKMDRFEMDRAALEAHPGAGRISATHSDAPIVVGIHHPREETGHSLFLQGHVDVVPTGPEHMWTHPPYSATIRDGRMYGRGAGDMKSGLVCAIAALDALRRAGWQPAATVYLASVVEEESTGNGAMMAHLRGYRAEAALIPEPTGESLVRANTGVLWFRVELEGVPVHVSHMGTGANAIDAAIRVIGALREVETRWNEEAASDPHFGAMEHPLNLNVGKIEGGEWASSVPARAAVDFRVSILPGWSAEERAAEIERQLSEFAASDTFLANNPPRLTWNGFFTQGYEQPEGTEAEAVLASAHEAAMGYPLGSHAMPAYLDARVHALFEGIPALCYGAKSLASHGFDESVDLASLERTTLAIALFIAGWCGLEPVAD